MPNPVQRLHYFDQQFLRAVDFTAEQDYHLGLRRAHNRSVHGWGIASGLTIQSASIAAVTVNAGYALDSAGREIVLAEDFPVDLVAQPPDAAVFITIAYAERTTDPSDETGVRDDTRWTEEPTIALSSAPPADPGMTLVLGRVIRTGTQVTGIDKSARVDASIPALAATLRAEAAARVSKAGDTMTGALTVQGAVTGDSLSTAGALSASAGAVARGIAIGRDPGGGVDYEYEYETVGVASPNFNLRLQSPNSIVFHTAGAARAMIDPTGALSINGDAGASVRLLVGAGANGRIKVRHIDGKQAGADGDDPLYLNWNSQQPVVLGGNLNWHDDDSANGSIRLGHLQICWGRQVINVIGKQITTAITYPAVFAQEPVVVTSIDDVGYGLESLKSGIGPYGVSNAGFTMLLKSNSVGGVVNATYIAIGVWQ